MDRKIIISVKNNNIISHSRKWVPLKKKKKKKDVQLLIAVYTF